MIYTSSIPEKTALGSGKFYIFVKNDNWPSFDYRLYGQLGPTCKFIAPIDFKINIKESFKAHRITYFERPTTVENISEISQFYIYVNQTLIYLYGASEVSVGKGTILWFFCGAPLSQYVYECNT